MILLGIDPGLSGGIAALIPSPQTPEQREFRYLPRAEAKVQPMPSTEADIMQHVLALTGMENPGAVAYIEDVPWIVAGPKQNAASRAKLHRNVGVLHGILLAFGVRIVKVRPQDWQAALHLGQRGQRTQTEWKNHLKAEAQRRFPSLNVTLATADALLILEYGRLMERV